MGEDKIYKTVIFDLDGTLYFQKPFRICMAKFLIKRILTHPGAIKDVMIIMKYRKVRENWQTVSGDMKAKDNQEWKMKEKLSEEQITEKQMEKLKESDLKKIIRSRKDSWSDLDRAQYTYVAGKMNCTPEKVAEIIYYYMQKAPLVLLPGYRDEELADMIDALQKRGTLVAIYSDYPVEDKLRALKIHVDKTLQFAAADEEIGCMKPEPQGLANILNILECKAEETLMVGDRMEKDGFCARSNEVDYVILEASKKKRHETELKLKEKLGLA